MPSDNALTPTPVNAFNPSPETVTIADAGDFAAKTPRLPRWTRSEILVLVQGKQVAENRVRRARVSGLGLTEPKWASVSGYCKRHGVSRGPVQCRKRWSNLVGDYRKIREWEDKVNGNGNGNESYWFMRNDVRREKKLPGFFDKEVYDVLDGRVMVVPELALALVKEVKEVDFEVVFDSGRSAAADDGLFSDFEGEGDGQSFEKESPVPVGVPILEKQHEPCPQGCQCQGTTNEEQPTSNPEIGSTSQYGLKRKRRTTEDEESVDLQYRVIDVLEKSGKMLTAQLEAQNANLQMDREQKKIHCDGLMGVLNKLADAFERIADKL